MFIEDVIDDAFEDIGEDVGDDIVDDIVNDVGSRRESFAPGSIFYSIFSENLRGAGTQSSPNQCFFALWV